MPDLEEFFVGSMGVIVLIYLVVPLFPLLYVIIRWRAGGQGEPGLGLYAGLLYFRSVALLVVVTGLALLLHSVVAEDSDSRGMESMRRVAGGLLTGGLVVWGMQLITLAQIQVQGVSDPAKRIFHGLLMIVSGLLSGGLIVGIAVALFQKNVEFDDVREVLVWAVVWTTTYFAHVALLRRGVT